MVCDALGTSSVVAAVDDFDGLSWPLSGKDSDRNSDTKMCGGFVVKVEF